MSDFKKRKKTRKLIYSKTSIFMVFSVLVVLSISTFNIYKKYKESLSNKKSSEEELKGLEQRNSELSARLERLKTERGLEEEIRKKFNVAKDGEGVVIIVPKSGTSSEEGSTQNETGFLGKFRGFFEQF